MGGGGLSVPMDTVKILSGMWFTACRVGSMSQVMFM